MTTERPAPVRRIVIAGGGSAGWMAAAALAVALDPRRVAITLVESEAIGTIGVGEATIPVIQLFNRLLGINETEFLKATGGTPKLGIEFAEWNGPGSCYIHPFGDIGTSFGSVPFHQHWLRARWHGDQHPITTYSLAAKAAEAGRFSPPTSRDPVWRTFSYAYHFDAGRYAMFLRHRAEAQGVQRIEGKIAKVELTHDQENPFIQALMLEDGQRIEGDFFLDCTGFRALLIGEALSTPYEDWSQWLPADRALAVPSPTLDPLPPYTRATAHEGGWRWRIPLVHRTGNGMVFSSAFWSSDGAQSALLSAVPGAKAGDVREIRFKTGRRTKTWVSNCVAIGLAGGFLEPLESTSLHLIQSAISKLLQHYPAANMHHTLRDEFNRQINEEYDRIRDFIVLHYHANSRFGDPLWDYLRNMSLPDSLIDKLDAWNASGRLIERGRDLFHDASWLAVLIGQGVLPRDYDRLADQMPAATVESTLQRLRQAITQQKDAMPSLAEWLAPFDQGNVLNNGAS